MPSGKSVTEQEEGQTNPGPVKAETERGKEPKSTLQRPAKLIPPQLCFSFGRSNYLSTTTWFLRRMEGGSNLPGLQGILNAGNTCYMNAAIQALAHCPPFMLYCLDCEVFIRHLSGPGVAGEFGAMMKQLWSTEKVEDYINPRPLARVMNNPVFMGIQQQDSQEFLRCLLDMMHEELKVEIKPDKQEVNSNSSSPNLQPEVAMEAVDKKAQANGHVPVRNGSSSRDSKKSQSQQPSHNYALRSHGECSANEPVGSSSQNRQPSASTVGEDDLVFPRAASPQATESSPGKLNLAVYHTGITNDPRTGQPRHHRLPEKHAFVAYELDLGDWSCHRVRPVHCSHGTCLLCSAKARYWRRVAPIEADDERSNGTGRSPDPSGDDPVLDSSDEKPVNSKPPNSQTQSNSSGVSSNRRRSLSKQEPVKSLDSAAYSMSDGEEEAKAAGDNGDPVPNGSGSAEGKEETMDTSASHRVRVTPVVHVTSPQSEQCSLASDTPASSPPGRAAVTGAPAPAAVAQSPADATDQLMSAGPSVRGQSGMPPAVRAMIEEAVSDSSSDEEDTMESTGRTSRKPSSTKPAEPAKEYRSIVTDIFGGITQSTVTCNACGQASKQAEPFLDLSISLPDSEQIQALLKARDAAMKQSMGSHTSAAASPARTAKVDITVKKAAEETSTSPSAQQLQHLQPGDKPPGLASRIWNVLKSAMNSRNLSIMDCLQIYFSPEELTGSNQYHCEECKTKVDGVRQVSLKKLPEIMCIHLKRFRHELQFSSKIRNSVSFPLQNLDLKQFLSDDNEEPLSTYELIAIVSHIGGVSGGHYVCYVRHFLSSNWYELDDINVQPVSEQTIAGVEAYMLFYKKSSPGLSAERAHVMRQVAAADNVPGQEICFVSRQWVHRFNTSFNPGPITNQDIICEHGGIGIYTSQEIFQMVTFAPRPLWDSLVERYGGGPMATSLPACTECRRSHDALLRRRHFEYQKFAVLNQAAQDEGQIIFLVDRNWFIHWRDYVHSNDPDLSNPGAIDNQRLLTQLRRYGKNLPKGLFPLELTWDAFFFLYTVYGGGPVLYAIG